MNNTHEGWKHCGFFPELCPSMDTEYFRYLLNIFLISLLKI